MNLRFGHLLCCGLSISIGGLFSLCIQPRAWAQQDEIQQLEQFLTPEPPSPPVRVYSPPNRQWRPSPIPSAPAQSSPAVLTLNSHQPGTLGRPNQLSDGFYRDLYSFEGTSGLTVAINLHGTSDPRMQLDPLLRLIAPSGTVVAEDDNGGSNSDRGDARILLKLPETGTYTIVVTTATPADKGRYALGLQEY